MARKLYNITKRFEVEMTFGVMAEDESEAFDVASAADYTDTRSQWGNEFIDRSVRVTDEEVVSVSESWADVEEEDGR
ncbi:MAG: hypothetical protein LUD72_13815 [Bacteroidales bacterium]|nr:hypothetical protein [Bacteroidales bacterium]